MPVNDFNASANTRPNFLFPNFSLSLGAAACALALTACGGGGDDSGGAAAPAEGGAAATQAAGSGAPANSSQAPVPVTPVTSCFTVNTAPAAAGNASDVTLLPVRGAAGVSGYRALGEPRAAGLCYANYRRVQVGLPPLAQQDALATVAQNHTAYMLGQNTLGHAETAGQPGYTGATPDARMRALYATDATAEVVAGASKWHSDSNATLALASPDALVADLVDAPFHRATLLGSYKSAGSGYAENRTAPAPGGASASFYQTVDLADTDMPGTANQMVAYPFGGQTDVPASWVNNENPNPAPGYEGRTLGYPVTLQAVDRSQAFNADQFAITDAGGNRVDCLKVDARSAGMSAYARGLAMCTPLAPLTAGTTYRVAVSGTLASKPVNIGWQFTVR